jgi:4-amino-4-deoxy-L-arabinose transferase-like glycosyltransferase
MSEPTAAPARAATADAQGRWPTTPFLIWLVPLLLIALTALQAYVAARMDFEADEAYYWIWSRHLEASYFDHPPMVAYLIRLGTALAGDTMLGIRLVALVSMVLVAGLLYALAIVLFGERRVALLSVLWLIVTPYAAHFAIIMFPDTPALLFWTLACVALALVWRTGRGLWWYVVGVAAGLLLLSKYTGMFLGFGILLWLLLSNEMRRWLKRPEPYVGGGVALALFSPVIIWNAQNGWVSFIKQFGRALDRMPQGGLANMGEFVGVQAGFLSPLIFGFLIAGLGVAAWRGLRRQEANWLLPAVTSGPMLLYFLVHAYSSEVLAQWPSAVYPAAIAAGVAAFLPLADQAGRIVLRTVFYAAPCVGLVFGLSLPIQMGWAPLPGKAADDPVARFFGWAGLASDTRSLARTHQAGYVTASDYCTYATLAYYIRELPVRQATEAIRYPFLPPLDPTLLSGSPGLYVEVKGYEGRARLLEHYSSVELIATIWRSRAGDPIEPYRIYLLKDYRGGMPMTGSFPISVPRVEC